MLEATQHLCDRSMVDFQVWIPSRALYCISNMFYRSRSSTHLHGLPQNLNSPSPGGVPIMNTSPHDVSCKQRGLGAQILSINRLMSLFSIVDWCWDLMKLSQKHLNKDAKTTQLAKFTSTLSGDNFILQCFWLYLLCQIYPHRARVVDTSFKKLR